MTTAAAFLTKGTKRLVSYPALVLKSRGQIWTLTKRELRGRYLSSVFGGLWAVVNPVVLLLVYYFVFAKIFTARYKGLGTDLAEETQFGFFLFCGMVPWMAFAECLQRSTNIIIENANLIKKVAFPSEILPIYVLVYTFINELIGIGILLISLLVVTKGEGLHFSLLFFPVIALLRMMLTLGFSYFFSAFNVFVRDVIQIVSLGLTLGMFMTPIFYPMSIVPEQYLPYYNLNPMMYVAEGYRSVFLEGVIPDFGQLMKFVLMALGVFTVGYGFFSATKHKFADEV